MQELAQNLGISGMTVRHHVQVLQAEGQVGAPQPVRRTIRGRPRLAYQLTKAAAADFPKEFAALAGHLIEAISTTAGSAEKVFFEVANKLAAGTPCAEPNAAIETRLDQAATFLTSKGYVADWEPTAAGPVLHTNNCPYGGLASAHPELCQMDLNLITIVTGSEVTRVCHAANGDSTCSYLLTPVLGAISIAA